MSEQEKQRCRELIFGCKPQKLNQSVGEIVREYFPGESDEFIDRVMWEETGWPGFWNTGSFEGARPEECLRYQLGQAWERRVLCVVPMVVIETEMREANAKFRAREAVALK